MFLSQKLASLEGGVVGNGQPEINESNNKQV
jgi:hypothetical protein